MTDDLILLTVKEITITWHIDDVIGLRTDLNEQEAMRVLRYCEAEFDANIGINWDIIDAAVNHLFGVSCNPR